MIEIGDYLKPFPEEQRKALTQLLRDLTNQTNRELRTAQEITGDLDVTGNITATGSITGTKLTLTEAAPATPTANTLYTSNIIKAWVNFDGTTSAALSGTYSRTGTTVTVTATAHGHRIGHRIYFNATTGTATDGIFTITTVADSNTFTFEHGTSGTTSGNVTLERSLIRAAFNVQSVPRSATGNWILNVATALPSTGIAVSFGIRRDSGGGDDSSQAGIISETGNPTVDAIRISATGTGGTAGLDVEAMTVIIV